MSIFSMWPRDLCTRRKWGKEQLLQTHSLGFRAFKFLHQWPSFPVSVLSTVRSAIFIFYYFQSTNLIIFQNVFKHKKSEEISKDKWNNHLMMYEKDSNYNGDPNNFTSLNSSVLLITTIVFMVFLREKKARSFIKSNVWICSNTSI